MTSRRPDDKTKIAALLLLWLAALGLARAEPEVDPAELPRIAPTEPADALGTFKLVAGHKLELVAAEPLVVDPIAMAFDEKRRLFVVEMRGYSERRDEQLGRVRLLADDDGDGSFDRSTVYAKDLSWPTAVIAWKGGIFVAATPDIYYFKDEDGDGVADSKMTVFSGFGAGTARLNVQALVNSFKWGPDGRIHGATAGNGGRVFRTGANKEKITELGGLDFSFDPDSLDLRAENGGGQYGLCFDDDGRKFVCSNSNHIQQIIYPRRYSGPPLPAARVGIADDGAAAEVHRLSKDEPWRVVRTRWRVAGQVRGPVEGGGRVSGYFTAATGICIHRNEAFICDAGSNLVHRKIFLRTLDDFHLIATRPEAEKDVEFLASTDNWFRPVQLISGPDGALYVADMYREVIEHPWSLPANIKKHLDLNSGNDRGRVYRIVADDFVQPAAVDFGKLSTAELIGRLSKSDRQLAIQVLRERRDRATVPALQQAFNSGPPVSARLPALQLLDTLGGLDEAMLLNALSNLVPAVRMRAIALSESFDPLPQRVQAKLATLASDPFAEVRYQLALSLGLREGAWRIPVLAEIVSGPCDDWTRAAVLKALGSSAGVVFDKLATSNPPPSTEMLLSLAAIVGEAGNEGEVARVREFAANAGGRRFRILAALARGRVGETWIGELSDDVRQVAQDRANNMAERLAAITLMGLMSDEEPEEFRALLVESDEIEIRDAVAEALGDWDEPKWAELMVQQWEKFSPQGKVHAVRSMLGTNRVQVMLHAIKDGKIPAHAVDGSTVDRLRKDGSSKISELADAVFDASYGDRFKVIAHYRKSLKLAGDPAAGRTHFLLRCSTCHRAGDLGFAYGPDVASFRSAGKELILTNLIDPNRELPPQYGAHEIKLDDDSSLVGRIVEQDDGHLRIALPAGIEKLVERKRVTRLTPLPLSPMPQGLEAGMSVQQMADLLAFLSGEGS